MQQHVAQKIVEQLLQEIAKAPAIESVGCVMKCPYEMIMSHSQAQHPDLKFCYVRMKDGTEMKFRDLNECVAFIRKMAAQSTHEAKNSNKDHFHDLTKMVGEETYGEI